MSTQMQTHTLINVNSQMAFLKGAICKNVGQFWYCTTLKKKKTLHTLVPFLQYVIIWLIKGIKCIHPLTSGQEISLKVNSN